MFTFEFVYSDGTQEVVENVSSIKFVFAGEQVSLKGDEILTYALPLVQYNLFGETTNSVMSGTNLLAVSVSKV